MRARSPLWLRMLRALRRGRANLVQWIDALWGYDVFIAHRRADAADYAQALHARLTNERISCCIDRVVYLPGDSLLVATRRHIAKSTLLLLLGSPQLLVLRRPTDWVEREIETFLETHGEAGRLLLVDFGEVVATSQAGPEAPAFFARLAPFLRIGQDAAALAATPTDAVLDAIRANLGSRRRDRARLHLFQGIALSLLGLLVLTIAGAGLATVAAQSAGWQRQIAEAERRAADARTLAATDASSLPRAGLMAQRAYLEMRGLAGPSPVPAWMRALASFLLDPGPAEYRLTATTLAAAEETMRLADDLTPALVASLPAAAAAAPEFAAAAPDGTFVLLHGGAFVRWRPEGSPEMTLRLEPLMSRVNGRANLAVSGDGTVVASELPGGKIRLSSTAGGMQRDVDAAALFPSAAFEPRPQRPSSGGVVTESFVAGFGSAVGTPMLAGLALDRRGSRLAVITRGGLARLFALQGNAPPQPLGPPWPAALPGLEDPMRMAIWQLDDAGELLAAAGSSHAMGQAPVMVWRAAQGQPTGPALIHEDGVSALAFSPDGTRLAAGLTNGNIAVWRLSDRQVFRTLDMGSPVTALAFAPPPGDDLLLAGGTGVARVFAMSARREVARIPQRGRVDVVAWTLDGARVLVGAAQAGSVSPVHLWDIDRVPRIADARMRTARGIQRLAIAGGVIAGFEYPTTLHVWDASTGRLRRSFPAASTQEPAIAIDLSGRHITALAGAEGLAARLDVDADQREILPGPGFAGVWQPNVPFMPLAGFDATGLRMFRIVLGSAGEACRIELWALAAPPVQMPPIPCPQNTRAAALAPDGSRIAWLTAAPMPQRLELRPVAGGAGWATPDQPPADSRVGVFVAFSGDGKRVAAILGQQVKVFDAASGNTIGAALRLDLPPFLVALDAHGTRIIVATADAVLRELIVADAATGTLLARFPFATDTRGGGNIVVTPDGSAIYAAFADNNVNNPRIWRWQLDRDRLADRLLERLSPILAPGDVVPRSDATSAEPNPSP